jgi:hypothetical protein
VCPLRQPGSHHFEILTPSPHVSHSGQGKPSAHCLFAGWLDAGSRHWPKGPTLTLSLSSTYKRGQWPEIFASFHRFFLHAELSTTARSLRLADDWLNNLSIPLAGLILVHSRSFCPRFHDHWARALASTALVRGHFVQLRSQCVSFFTNLTLGSTFDAIGHRQPDHLAGETPSPTSFP